MRNIKFFTPQAGSHLIDRLKKNDLLFYPKKSKGIIPINFNLDEYRKVIKSQFLFLAPRLDECFLMLNDTKKHFQSRDKL